MRRDYALLEVMGTPGQEVFRARASDGRYVVLRYFKGDSESATRAAQDLVEAASSVRHPMLAAAFGCEQSADGTLCIIAEYVPGRTLDAWVGDAGVLDASLAVDFVRRLALGLQSAHQRGVNHSALYPGNIVVLEPDTRPRGRIAAKLLDLGIPRSVRSAPRFEAAHFMAPEALAAELDGAVRPSANDARQNVYSCGCLLHYLCTGQPPYQSDSLQGLASLHARREPRFGPGLPRELERVIEQALEVDPKRRLASAAALAAALARTETRWRGSGVHPKLAPDLAQTACARDLTTLPTVVLDPLYARAVAEERGTSARIAARVGLTPLAPRRAAVRGIGAMRPTNAAPPLSAAALASRPSRPAHFEASVRRLSVPPPAGAALVAATPTRGWAWARTLLTAWRS